MRRRACFQGKIEAVFEVTVQAQPRAEPRHPPVAEPRLALPRWEETKLLCARRILVGVRGKAKLNRHSAEGHAGTLQPRWLRGFDRPCGSLRFADVSLTRCLDLGADLYRLKPLNLAMMREVVGYAVEKRAFLRKRRRFLCALEQSREERHAEHASPTPQPSRSSRRVDVFLSSALQSRTKSVYPMGSVTLMSSHPWLASILRMCSSFSFRMFMRLLRFKLSFDRFFATPTPPDAGT